MNILILLPLLLVASASYAGEISIPVTRMWSQTRVILSGRESCNVKTFRYPDESIGLKVWFEFKNLLDDDVYVMNARTENIEALPLQLGWSQEQTKTHIGRRISYDGTVFQILERDEKRGPPAYTRIYEIWSSPDLKNVSRVEERWLRGDELIEHVVCDPNMS